MSGLPLGRLTISQPRQVIGMRMPEADRLRERLLGGEARREVAHAALLELGAARAEDSISCGAEHAARRSARRARASDGRDAAHVADVGADAVDHRAAALPRPRRMQRR